MHYVHYSNEFSFSQPTVKEHITKSFLYCRHIGPAKGPWTPDSEIKNFTIYVDGFHEYHYEYLRCIRLYATAVDKDKQIF